MPEAPGLEGGSRPLELFGGLTLGKAPSLSIPGLFREVRTFESIPAWLALRVALFYVLDDGSHRDLLCQSLALE
jgi:hypothetical protein